MIAIIKNLFKHKHKWKDTRINRFFIATEQKCKCGEYRHHFWIDYKDGEPIWRAGKHPNSIENDK